ncbi:hypothetical protein jhhlp_003961 [Lomentospora prolificans]|uniref:Major facilitator superfamily (MFS) profile domain-containing protein n=1 Tax=Lomentospora prolificans TaxID=41688 RepID=A0A2N3NAC1_9PEZI|nr:hypothetical protein jhhlp_003961 [Lomentospora prolificans]
MGIFSWRNGKDRTKVNNDNPDAPPKWSMGVLNDKYTVEVPGSVLLLAKDRNEPLGLRHAPARTSQSSLPTGQPFSRPGTPRRSSSARGIQPVNEVKKTQDGKIILEPQPEDSANDPLNWPTWRRDAALLSLGFYCMIGGGITPLLAAGFGDVALDYDVEVEQVALTTGLYMLGLGLGSVIASPTAILFGKRPVYLVSAFIFIASCVWCALSPSFGSLVAARILQGIAVSPVECLPSATIAEIFFLHERAYRIGIYTLLLLGGKNLVPLISALVIQNLGWRWVFWVVAIIVAFWVFMLFFFVPETFWDRTPVPKSRAPSRRPSFIRRISSRFGESTNHHHHPATAIEPAIEKDILTSSSHHSDHLRGPHVGFAPGTNLPSPRLEEQALNSGEVGETTASAAEAAQKANRVNFALDESSSSDGHSSSGEQSTPHGLVTSDAGVGGYSGPSPPAKMPTVGAAAPTPYAGEELTAKESTLKDLGNTSGADTSLGSGEAIDSGCALSAAPDLEKLPTPNLDAKNGAQKYTHTLRHKPAQTFVQQLKPYHGRLSDDAWFKVMLRPFILYSYPAILWSSAVYSCSVGWLIVISESMAMIYQNRDSYHFNALQTGLVYISPFVGGLFGTAVAGKVSDIVVKAMARRNGGLYEPEFRLVMAIPILFTTVIGLMGFGWSAEERDHWIVPTVFFGIVSFGCSLGSTTSITFCVDSYRQYAGEALVTLNFSKNVLHGFVFSLFFTHWLSSDGSRMVFIWTGVIQLIIMLTTIPLFIYGKRLRMWTVRKNMLEKVLRF